MSPIQPSRRHALAGLAAALALPALAGRAIAGAELDLDSFDLAVTGQADHTKMVQAVVDAASKAGKVLSLPPSTFYVSELTIPGSLVIRGIPGKTTFASFTEKPVVVIKDASDVLIENVAFTAFNAFTVSADSANAGIVKLDGATDVTFRDCSFAESHSNGLVAINSTGTIENCTFENVLCGIHSLDSTLTIRGNRIWICADAGIRIWRSEIGEDRSIVTGNRIGAIDYASGGNGQNGNGISIYRADDVIVSDNFITDCAFSAIRVNAGNNTQIRGNTCLKSREVAIFSEFAFSGSVIADNIVDDAAMGISITNLDSGGHLATCTGNIVRNIASKSETNPDTQSVGIYAEADTVIANNTVSDGPRLGIVAGYGPFVRNVIITGNVITGAQYGIGVTVVQEQSPGPVRVTGNLISGGARPIVGLEWEKIATEDLAKDVGRYPNLTVSDNTIG